MHLVSTSFFLIASCACSQALQEFLVAAQISFC